MVVLRRSSPHEWAASFGTSPTYSRELESNWTLAKPVWHVTTIPPRSLDEGLGLSFAKYSSHPLTYSIRTCTSLLPGRRG